MPRWEQFTRREQRRRLPRWRVSLLLAGPLSVTTRRNTRRSRLVAETTMRSRWRERESLRRARVASCVDSALAAMLEGEKA